jgi:N-acetylglucosaminyldiphosphoundecaprenol N-acetyl-beta-D-mannosaminyltransferase
MSPQRQRIIEQFDQRFSTAAIRRRKLNCLLRSNAWLVWIQILSATRRALDFLLAAALFAVLSPVLATLFAIAKIRGGGLIRTARLGRWGCTFHEFSLSSGLLASLPALLNVIRGDMSLIGPRPVSSGELSAQERAGWRRYDVRPGFICLWWIRKRANIAWGSESDADLEYLDCQSFWGDVAIGLRAIPAAFFGEGVAVAPERVHFMGITFDNLTMDEAVAAIVDHTGAGRSADSHQPESRQLCFANADCVNIAYRDGDYRRLLANSALVLADGIGLKLAGRILNNNIRQNVNGTDLFPPLCAAMAKEGRSIYLLGGQPGVPEGVAAWIAEHHPGLRVGGLQHGFFSAEENPAVLADIRNSGADILLVAFGVPKQEKWIRDHLPETCVGFAMGVGGLFDFYSGRIPRAPVWIRELGVEWLYRFAQEPRRMWRRYFVGNFVFLFRAFRERLATQDRRPPQGSKQW